MLPDKHDNGKTNEYIHYVDTSALNLVKLLKFGFLPSSVTDLEEGKINNFCHFCVWNHTIGNMITYFREDKIITRVAFAQRT